MKSNAVETNQALKTGMEVEIGFPQLVQIALAQVNELRHYEIFTWLASLFMTAAAGFWVSFAAAPFNKVLFGVSLVFSLFTLAFGGMAFYYRQKINGTKITKTIKIENLS